MASDSVCGLWINITKNKYGIMIDETVIHLLFWIYYYLQFVSASYDTPETKNAVIRRYPRYTENHTHSSIYVLRTLIEKATIWNVRINKMHCDLSTNVLSINTYNKGIYSSNHFDLSKFLRNSKYSFICTCESKDEIPDKVN